MENGGRGIIANDEHYGSVANLTAPGRGVNMGDGWETRRRREPGHDWCLVRLGLPGIPRGVVVDTSHFRGNFPESCSLEACAVDGHPAPEELMSAAWTEILPRSPLEGNMKNTFALQGSAGRVTHLRFNIYPDGGVARLRVYGEVAPDWTRLLRRGSEIDLAGVENGGVVLCCSDMFFGNRHNLILPGPSLGMHDGWETRRRRGPGHDWAIVKLGVRAGIHRAEVDTSHFKGNAPGSCSIEACDAAEALPEHLAQPTFKGWREILPRTALRPHTQHLFDELAAAGPFTHARLNIYPDGGVARLRLFGKVSALDRLNAVSAAEAEALLRPCCGSRAWAHRLAESRPFRDLSDLREASDRIWWDLEREDWLEAFAAHPRIGERKAAPAQGAQAAAWSAQEQSGTAAASDETMNAMASANREYEKRFGYIYIVCATGRSGDEMLAMAWQRLNNDPDNELRVAAEEQRKIMQLRLMKLVE
jgi:allantoicase